MFWIYETAEWNRLNWKCLHSADIQNNLQWMQQWAKFKYAQILGPADLYSDVDIGLWVKGSLSEWNGLFVEGGVDLGSVLVYILQSVSVSQWRYLSSFTYCTWLSPLSLDIRKWCKITNQRWQRQWYQYLTVTSRSFTVCFYDVLGQPQKTTKGCRVTFSWEISIKKYYVNIFSLQPTQHNTHNIVLPRLDVSFVSGKRCSTESLRR